METNPNLTVADMAVMKNIIDLAASRGTFRASEMKSVGDIYEKLTAFLDHVVEQSENSGGA